MRAALIALAALGLTACQTVPASVHVDAGKALIAAETAVDAAAVGADVAVKAGLTTKAQDRQIAALVPQVEADLVLARKAYAASDAATMLQLATQLTALAASLNGAHP